MRGIADGPDSASFDELTLRDVEVLLADCFRAEGYVVLHGHSGATIELSRGGELFLVQCEHWSAHKVPVTVMRELYAETSRRSAAGAFIVTAGTFTDEAIAFVQDTSIQLVDGQALAQRLRQGCETA